MNEYNQGFNDGYAYRSPDRRVLQYINSRDKEQYITGWFEGKAARVMYDEALGIQFPGDRIIQ